MIPVHKRLVMRLKALRAKQSLSQADLAKKAGLTREYIARLETGRHDPSLSVLISLAKALKVKVEELLG
jgi:putative transcriptional regulator